MDQFEHNGVILEYEVSGTGIPFVFLHGMGGSVEQIRSVYEPVRGIRLISMNQQGHGNSGVDWDRYDFDHLGDDVIALLDHMGVEKAVLGGISMGAAVSLNTAVRYPERVQQLLLIRNAWTDHPMPEDVRTAYHDLGHALRNCSIEEFYDSKGWRIVRETTEYTRHAFTSTFEDLTCLRYWQKYLILPDKTPIPNIDVLKRLTMPVTIIACRNDLCHPYEYGSYLAGQIADASFIEIPDKDTDGMEHKRMINEAILRMF
ncbi:MAG TPA: hypothetical protein DCZ91_11195 [Lachnospiraceae bacterium]|nr:hypothetical protein [Lachnospiraceae bacterium]